MSGRAWAPPPEVCGTPPPPCCLGLPTQQLRELSRHGGSLVSSPAQEKRLDVPETPVCVLPFGARGPAGEEPEEQRASATRSPGDPTGPVRTTGVGDLGPQDTPNPGTESAAGGEATLASVLRLQEGHRAGGGPHSW